MIFSTMPDAFRKIQLELAREPQHPEGDPNESYVLVAPLTEDGRLDAAAWRDNRDMCRVVRQHGGETAVGHLVHTQGGGWRFRYDIIGQAEEESGFRFADERLTAGEYVSIVRGDGEHPFRIVSVAEI